MDVQSAAKGMNVPLTCMEGIWRKAADLLHNPTAMVSAPGQSPFARMVLCYSAEVPHLVTPTKGVGFNCDATYPNWKSLSFCSHTVAVAGGKLVQFVAFLLKRKKSPNITGFVTCSMPMWCGRKGGAAPCKQKPTVEPTARVPMTVHSTESPIHTKPMDNAGSRMCTTSTSLISGGANFSAVAMVQPS